MCDRGNGGYLPLEQLQRAQIFADKAAEHLEKSANTGSVMDLTGAERHLNVAREYIKLAAIERGLIPAPDANPIPASTF